MNIYITVFSIVTIISFWAVLLKSRFNLKISFIYLLLCMISIFLSKYFIFRGMLMSIIFSIFYFYIIPNLLKKEREEDEKITEDLKKFLELPDEEKIQHIKDKLS